MFWVQHNRAACHISYATIDLHQTFDDRLIRRNGNNNWPPRSCELTPLDYFVLGAVKEIIELYVEEINLAKFQTVFVLLH